MHFFFCYPSKTLFRFISVSFPIITTSETLAELDRYMVECIRFIRTGTHTKANYRLRYETIKSLGFRSLVHEYYRGLKEPKGGEEQE